MSDLRIPGDLLAELHLTPDELRTFIAVHLYDQERLSMGQAKRLANLTQLQFQQALLKNGIYIKYDKADLAIDLANLKEL